MMIKLQLPYPPSINHYWRKWNNRMVVSKAGRTYREEVCALLSSAGGTRTPPLNCGIAISIDVFPPDRRRRDLDNIQKPLLDALEHAGVYENDSLVDILVTRRRERHDGGRIVVSIESIPPNRCPLCGGRYSN